MEEAPQGTFQDELDWCISQLETGLLRLSPTPEQVEDSRRILRVLRSCKAPVVKKRQVMHQVFGDYRLKMTKELKRASKAAVVKSEKVEIQPVDTFPLGSVVVYRKQSGQPSASSSWFTPSASSFQFHLDRPERTPEEMNRTTDEANGVDSSQEQTAGDVPPTLEGQREMLHFSTGTQGPKFAFNFAIPERLPPPSAAAVWRFEAPSWEVAAEVVTESDTPSRDATEIPESLVSPNHDRLDATSGRCRRDDGSPSLEVTQEAVKSEKVEIQPGDAFPSGIVVYRKQSGQPSASSSWFTPSASSFQFRLDRPERTPEEMNRTTDEANGVDSSQEQTAGDVPPTLEGQREMLHFSTGTQGPKFAFNFAIPERPPPPSAAAVWRFEAPSWEVAAEAVTESDTPSRDATEIPESLVSPNHDRLDATSGRCRRDDGSPSLEVTQEEKEETLQKETSAAAASRSSKRKKRKKRPSKVEPNKNVNKDNRLCVKATSDQTEMCQQSDEQLKREVDWCVEQLELGLETQKPTPKQVDEMLRAIKTLRSEKAVLAKKRQIMRFMFGDYRKRMAEERQKQLKLMRTASKAARITEVTEDARRKNSQVFRKSVEVAGRSRNPKDPLLSSENPQQPDPLLSFPRGADFCPFTFTPSGEKFRFNFF